ncbi:MAG: hypothetical protein WCP99_04545 [Burkholderiales bacterium]
MNTKVKTAIAGSLPKSAWAFAEILNEDAKELAAAGPDIVQVDEPAFPFLAKSSIHQHGAARTRSGRGQVARFGCKRRFVEQRNGA